jgi:hypothetical protein
MWSEIQVHHVTEAVAVVVATTDAAATTTNLCRRQQQLQTRMIAREMYRRDSH